MTTRRELLGAAGAAAFVGGFPPIPGFDANSVGSTGVMEIDGYVVVQTGGIKSANWQEGVRGWSIDGDGNAEFNDLTVRGDVISTNWNGGLDLSGGKDGTATVGFFLDSSAGAAQFEEIYADGGELGDLTVTGQLSLPSGGSLKSTTLGGTEISDTDSLLRYASGGIFDVRGRGDSLPQIQASTSGVTIAGGPTTITGTLDVTGAIFSAGSSSSPSISGSDSNSGIYFSGAATLMSYNGSQKFTTTSTGVDINGTLSVGGISATNLVTGAGFRSSISGGTSAAAFGFSSDLDLGMFRAGANDGRLAAGGQSVAQFTVGRFGPGADNARTLGGAGLRWSEIYMVGGIGSVNNVSRDANGLLTVATSSRRYKNRIGDFDGGVDMVDQFRPRTFKWNDDPKISVPFEDRWDVGLIAEEVADIPGADRFVLFDDEGLPVAVRYDLLTIPMINAIRELVLRVEELERTA